MPIDTRILRFQVVETMHAATCLAGQIALMRPYLQRWGNADIGTAKGGGGLAQFHEPVGKHEEQQMRSFLRRCYPEYGVIFDATPSFAEAVAIIYTVVTKDWVLHKVLYSCKFLKKGLNGEDTRTLLDEQIAESPMTLEGLRPAMCDRCMVNSKGLRLLAETQSSDHHPRRGLLCVSPALRIQSVTLVTNSTPRKQPVSTSF